MWYRLLTDFTKTYKLGGSLHSRCLQACNVEDCRWNKQSEATVSAKQQCRITPCLGKKLCYFLITPWNIGRF